jgi:hypothetical protein
MQRLLHSLAVGSVVLVCFQQGCGSETEPASPTGSGPSAAANATNGTGYDPVCNAGRTDGFCNVFGNDPETCECRDCIASASCQGRCVDDGQCNRGNDEGPGEDCTCADCAYVIDDCGGGQGEGNGPSTQEATVTGSGGGGGAGPGPGPSSTAETTAASTAETTAASTAETTASTTAGSGGGGGAPP